MERSLELRSCGELLGRIRNFEANWCAGEGRNGKFAISLFMQANDNEFNQTKE
jgi:hypothetical protein